MKATSRHYDWVHAVSYDRTNECYAVATKDGSVELIRPMEGDVVRRLHGHAKRVWSLAFSSDGSHLATASTDRTVKIWQLVAKPQTLDDSTQVCVMALTADGRTVATGNSMGEIQIMDLPSKKPIASIGADYKCVAAVANEARAVDRVSRDFNPESMPASVRDSPSHR